MKVFITSQLPSEAVYLLRKEKIKFEIYKKDKTIRRNELIKKIKDTDGIVSLLTEKFDKEVIDQLSRCRIIANVAVGYNNIDVEYAKKKGIIVTNTPDVLTDSTADLTVALILSCARRLFEGEVMMRKRKFKGWKPDLLLGVELRNKIAGIIGTGRIGTETAIRLKSFKTDIVYFDRGRKPDFEDKVNAAFLPLDELLRKSDIISVHLPLTRETHHLLNGERLALLKKTAILVNTSRGEIIDEKELIKILRKKKIFSAGLDVYENEPSINPQLLKLENVVLLPHIGSATTEARTAMAALAIRNVISVLKTGTPLTPVN